MTKSRYHSMRHKHHGSPRHHGYGAWRKHGMWQNYWNEYSFPKVNVFEENDHYLLEFNVPGYKKEDFKVAIENHILRVSARVDKEEQRDTIRRKEFSVRNFKREFELNEKIDTDAVTAEYSGGILAVQLGKKEEFKGESKEIKID